MLGDRKENSGPKKTVGIKKKQKKTKTKKIAQIFFAGVEQGASSQRTREVHSKGEGKPARQGLKKDQCAFCKEIGHWKNKCPQETPKGKTHQAGVLHILHGGPHPICRRR